MIFNFNHGRLTKKYILHVRPATAKSAIIKIVPLNKKSDIFFKKSRTRVKIMTVTIFLENED